MKRVEADWLTGTEQAAWQGVLALFLLGMPDLERTFKRYGLVHVEYGLLHRLSEAPGGLRLCDLAEGMNVSQSRLSHRMTKLTDRGLVEIRQSTDDGRVSLAHLTAAGRDLLAEIAPHHVADVRRMIFDRLSPEQTGALADALGAVTDGLLRPGCPGTTPEGRSAPGPRSPRPAAGGC